jgi:carbamoyltransferase
MIIWGVSALFHDAGLSVIKDGKIVFGAHAERYSGVKHDKHLNQQIIDEALTYGMPDKIAWYEKPYKKNLRKIQTGEWWYTGFNTSPKKYLKQFGIKGPKVITFDHHYSHAAAGAFTSPLRHGTVVVLDAIGEFVTSSVWKYTNGSKLEKLYDSKYPSSFGLLYSAFTQRCGLKPMDEEYITMGMAAWGKPIYAKKIKKDFIKSYYPFALKKNVHKGIGDYLPKADVMDIAASIQQVAEEFISHYCTKAIEQVGIDDLIYQGGVALNCVANSNLYQKAHSVWIMPNPGDCGSSLGSALAMHGKQVVFPGAYIGTNIDLPYPVDAIISELDAKKIVGVASGRAEFGPRALGHRSLLADPRGSEIKDKVNEIKRRQKFRPFAPAILKEHVNEYFDICTDDSPYMQFVGICKKPNEFPAIIHVDGTSRVQTVGPDDSPGFRALLEKWYAKTGCPMLLNTSLNIRGEPMVNTRADADRFEEKYGIKVCS